MSDPAPQRRIAHLDMDAFFASVALLRFPQLKGLPVVIGGGRWQPQAALARLRTVCPERNWTEDDWADAPLEFFERLSAYTGRGVATTATYAARQFGVGSAMGLMKAAKLCPQAILLPVDFDTVRRLSQRFKAAIREVAPLVEDRGVDEVFIDFTEVPGGQREGGRVLARLIQKQIQDATGLSCSIGVAPNKLIAKMASEFNKPAGISVVHSGDLQRLIWPLACRKLNGVGPKTDERLQAHGIHTIAQLAAQERGWLLAHFGQSHGAWLHDAAWGRDERPLVTESEPVSMSRETTFERDLHAVRDRAELGAIFTRLCEQVAGDLQRKGYTGRTIGIKLRYDNFQSVTRDLTVAQACADAATIRKHAGQCLKRVDLGRRIRLLGVRVGKLVPAGSESASAAHPSAVPSPNPSAHVPPSPGGRETKVFDAHTHLLFPELE